MFKVALLAFCLAAVQSVVADVPVWGQCGGQNWTGETTCESGSTCTFQNEWYSQCLPGGSGGGTTSTTHTSPTTTKPPTTTTHSGSTPSGITTTLPASAGYVALPTASVITGSFDGNMVKYDRKGSSGECQGQTETGEEDAVFILESGASISNVIIGADQAEGIHCRGPCTLTNVWWEDVCEDALTLEQTGSGDVSTIIGGGAFHAEDKIIQHNGAGLVVIRDFFASDFGKVYRACGNCKTSHERHVQIDNLCMHSGSEGVGINTNFGDTAKLSNIKTSGKPSAANTCCTYTGVAAGSEPPKIGCGDGFSACQYSESDVGSC